MSPTASVIIPCFNVATTLDEQLKRLLPQIERAGAELILVDNNSTDQTSTIIDVASRHPNVITHLATSGQSVSYARNAGAELASADRLLFCDADDVVSNDWVDVMLAALDNHPIVTGVLDVTSLNSTGISASRGVSNGPASFYDIFPLAHGGNMGVTSTTWQEIGPLDEDLGSLEDMEWSLRAFAAGHHIVREPAALIGYRYRTTTRDLWAQGLNYGVHRPHIARLTYERLGQRPPRWAGLRSWIWLLANLKQLGTPDGRAQLAWVAGNRIGNLKGSAKARFVVL